MRKPDSITFARVPKVWGAIEPTVKTRTNPNPPLVPIQRQSAPLYPLVPDAPSRGESNPIYTLRRLMMRYLLAFVELAVGAYLVVFNKWCAHLLTDYGRRWNRIMPDEKKLRAIYIMFGTF